MLKSFDEMTPDQQLAYKMGYEAARSELRVAGPDDLVIRREDGKWQFDPTVLDGYPALYELRPKVVEALSALGVSMFPTNNRYIIWAVLDALAAAEGGEEE